MFGITLGLVILAEEHCRVDIFFQSRSTFFFSQANHLNFVFKTGSGTSAQTHWNLEVNFKMVPSEIFKHDLMLNIMSSMSVGLKQFFIHYEKTQCV